MKADIIYHKNRLYVLYGDRAFLPAPEYRKRIQRERTDEGNRQNESWNEAKILMNELNRIGLPAVEKLGAREVILPSINK